MESTYEFCEKCDDHMNHENVKTNKKIELSKNIFKVFYLERENEKSTAG